MSSTMSSSNDSNDQIVNQKLQVISSAIQKISFSLVEGFGHEVDVLVNLGSGLRETLLYNTAVIYHDQGKSVRDFLHIALTSSICATIFQTVFKPFKFGIEYMEDKTISDIYNNIKANRSQKEAALWRSITYTSTSSDLNQRTSNEDKAKLISALILSNLNLLLKKTLPQAQFNLSHVDETFCEISRLALEWKDLVSGQILEANYEAFNIPEGDDFASDEEMEKIQEKGEVVGVNSFGLRRKVEGKTQVIEWPGLKWERDN